jgi:hypothetical protein
VADVHFEHPNEQAVQAPEAKKYPLEQVVHKP